MHRKGDRKNRPLGVAVLIALWDRNNGAQLLMLILMENTLGLSQLQLELDLKLPIVIWQNSIEKK